MYFNTKFSVESSTTVKDIIDMILSIPKEQEPQIEDIRIYLSNPKSMSYYVYNQASLLEEKIQYFDPLYSNNYIRNSSDASTMVLRFKLGSSEEVSMIDHRVVPKKTGYAKFAIPSVNGYYQWRQCNIKHQKHDKFNVKFKSFEKNCNY